jgi:hypothetical protein
MRLIKFVHFENKNDFLNEILTIKSIILYNMTAYRFYDNT